MERGQLQVCVHVRNKTQVQEHLVFVPATPCPIPSYLLSRSRPSAAFPRKGLGNLIQCQPLPTSQVGKSWGCIPPGRWPVPEPGKRSLLDRSLFSTRAHFKHSDWKGSLSRRRKRNHFTCSSETPEGETPTMVYNPRQTLRTPLLGLGMPAHHRTPHQLSASLGGASRFHTQPEKNSKKSL